MQMALFRVFQELLGFSVQHAVYHVPVCEHIKGAFVFRHVSTELTAKWKKGNVDLLNFAGARLESVCEPEVTDMFYQSCYWMKSVKTYHRRCTPT